MPSAETAIEIGAASAAGAGFASIGIHSFRIPTYIFHLANLHGQDFLQIDKLFNLIYRFSLLNCDGIWYYDVDGFCIK